MALNCEQNDRARDWGDLPIPYKTLAKSKDGKVDVSLIKICALDAPWACMAT